MIKTLSLNKYKYQFSNMYKGYVNITFDMKYKKISLISNQLELILYAKQYSLRDKLITCIPFLDFKSVAFEVDKCPFKIYNHKHKEVGYIQYIKAYKFKITLYDDIYYTQLHRGNKVSVCKNNKQVALIEKDLLYSFVKSEYRIKFNSNIGIDILNFITMFVDSCVFGFRCAPFALGTKFVLCDDMKELGKWNEY